MVGLYINSKEHNIWCKIEQIEGDKAYCTWSTIEGGYEPYPEIVEDLIRANYLPDETDRVKLIMREYGL